MKISGALAPVLAVPRPEVIVLHTFRERSSDQVTMYDVRLLSDGTWSCQCKGYHYKGYCRHIGKHRLAFLGAE